MEDPAGRTGVSDGCPDFPREGRGQQILTIFSGEARGRFQGLSRRFVIFIRIDGNLVFLEGKSSID
ncbi:MAG: hypothetical protein EOP84_32760 [Verrucomicrobiaceae bacterium]|nr:MAG: hypothetical protein EOP84_32760 [Verrucomicrobiaceae bacterium]